MQETETLQGEVLRLTYQDPYSGFAVAKLLPQKSSREVSIVGYMPFIQVGQTVRCTGFFEINPRHGKQFSVQKLSYELPSDPSSIEKLLASGFLKGIGPQRAAKIVEAFGKDTFHVLDQSPEKFYTIPALGKKCVDTLITGWQERTELQEIYLILCDYGLSHAMTAKVLRRYGSKTIKIVQENPYQLAKEISGIGFQAADSIASRIGIDPLSPIRIDAALEYLLWEFCTQGHTCVPFLVFVEHAKNKLEAPTTLIEDRLKNLFEKKEIILFKPSGKEELFVSPKKMYAAEQAILSHIARLQSSPCNLRTVDTEKAVSWAEQTVKMTFAEQQKEAIAVALTEKICIITGGPGTGKSTITKAILAISSKLTSHITLAAPTGRAAKRLSEMVHKHAHTIHRLLKFNPGIGSFEHNAQNPLKTDLLIVDESSMIDTNLALQLLEAIPDTARLIIIGDVDQLPSIGPGTVLSDLIQGNLIKTVRLTEIFRQARHSHIISNAHRINQGKMIFLTAENSDFLFYKVEEPSAIRKQILSLISQTLPEKYRFDPAKDIQVLSPMRRGEVGIDQLNIDLQAYFSPHKQKNIPYAVGDKVIQCKNNYKKEVFNGDIGFVSSIDTSTGQVSVDFEDRTVAYDPLSIDELSLAWAVSIHKYQGSECPCVVIPIHTQHFKLLNKNLLYTAVTRGKKIVVLVGLPKAVALAISTYTNEPRWTNLKSTHNNAQEPQ